MSRSKYSPAVLVTALLSLVPVAIASQVIPCAVGSGTNNGCSYCADKGIDVTPWSSATKDANFDLPTAASKTGGGYDVWWNIGQPDPGCRVILTEPYITDKGNVDSRLSGNVVLSVAHGGCYYAHVGSGGVSAAFCCGSGDCATAGATASKKKRELPMSRIARGLISNVEARGWGGSPPPAPAGPSTSTTCTAPIPNGDTYTKAGKQQINGQTLNCNGGESCNMSPSMSVSAADSLMNEHSTTQSTTDGVSISVSAGFMMLDGPMASVTSGWNHDYSNAVMNAFSETTTSTVTKTLTLSIGLVPGANFNLWFTPTLSCRMFTTKCNGVQLSIEKCSPQLDGSGNPTGDHGVMTIG